MQIKHEPTELELAIRELRGTLKQAKFILWLIHDPIYGLLQNVHDAKKFDAIKLGVPLYEEWLNSGEKPSEMEGWKNNLTNNRFYLNSIDEAIKYGITNYISTYAIRIKVGKNNMNSVNDRQDAKNAQLNKIKELNEADGLFTWEDYENE